MSYRTDVCQLLGAHQTGRTVKLFWRHLRLAATLAATFVRVAGRPATRTGISRDQNVSKLLEHTVDLDQRLAGWCESVDALLQRHELDAMLFQIRHQFDQSYTNLV